MAWFLGLPGEEGRGGRWLVLVLMGMGMGLRKRGWTRRKLGLREREIERSWFEVDFHPWI